MALFQAGGSDWKRWNRALQAALLPLQAAEGDEAGSWAPAGEWCIVGGRAYATALGALTLEVYYRYERPR
jgi:hypothetical protein